MSEKQLQDEVQTEESGATVTHLRSRSGFAGTREPASQPRLDRHGRPLVGTAARFADPDYWTPERREAQRQRAKDMIEAGTFGSVNGFHRRKTKKFQEIVAEHAQTRADAIIARLDVMLDGRDKRLQLEAIREFAKFEDWAVKNAREDEKEYRKLSGAQLDAVLLEVLGDALGLDLSELTVESTAVDVPQLPASDETQVYIEVDGKQVPVDLSAFADAAYDPMEAELGGDRLRASAEALDGDDD